MWTASASDVGSAPLYQFTVRRPGSASLTALRDFHARNTFAWMPLDEGTYEVKVTAKPAYGVGPATTAVAAYVVTSRVSGSAAVITPTAHPLVALYSAPPCAPGQQIKVQFRAATAAAWQSTHLKPCDGASANFLIAGMLPSTQHLLRHAIINGPDVVTSPATSFTTGAAAGSFPAFAVSDPIDSATSVSDDVLLHELSFQTRRAPIVLATDLAGRLIWYYDKSKQYPNDGFGYATRLLPGGTVLVIGNLLTDIVMEVDLAGITLWETNVGRLNEQLVARGEDQISGFHHEAVRLPNGHTLVLGYVERIYNDVQGVSGPVDILGNVVIDLDRNWQVSWVWNGFDHLDINRAAVLGEVCGEGRSGCPPIRLASTAHDWLHMNAIAYSPLDRNLLFSVRNQDWVVKVDYRDGAGTGQVLWRLGVDGDFAAPPGPYPWFSHQHDLAYNGTRLGIFDNGNTRCQGAGPSCHSRGQVYDLDEAARTVTIRLNADLGAYAEALGAAAPLANGNWHFTSGFLRPGGTGQSIEVLPTGAVDYVQVTTTPVYRSYRLPSLYSAPLLPEP